MGDVRIGELKARLASTRVEFDTLDSSDEYRINQTLAEIHFLRQQLDAELLAAAQLRNTEIRGVPAAQQVGSGPTSADTWDRPLDFPTLFRNLKQRFGQQREGALQRPPGYGLLWFADFFYSRKSVDECLRPTIQDLQDEYTEALAANRPHKARWVRTRGTWSFVCAAGMLTMASVGKQVVKIWKAVG